MSGEGVWCGGGWGVGQVDWGGGVGGGVEWGWVWVRGLERGVFVWVRGRSDEGEGLPKGVSVR